MTEGGTQFGRFRLVEPLGQGGMAEIWRARVEGDGGFSRDVVIKRIIAPHNQDSEFAAMFAREARLSARLRHANIVQVFEYGEVEGDPYLAMEFIEGIDLQRLVTGLRQEGRRLGPAHAAYVAREVARALKYVHEAKDDAGTPLGLVHRDVSPSNILVAYDGSVKLVDFGIAKTSDERPLTQAGTFRGKLAYSAPEVVGGQVHDARSDVFALGITLYEMLAGKRLFVGETEAQTFGLVHAAVVRPLSQFIPDIPPALEAVCLRALARLPGDRYETAELFIAELDPVVRELQVGAEQLSTVVGSLPRTKPRSLPANPSARTPGRDPAVEITVEEAARPARWPWVAGLAVVALIAGGLLFRSSSASVAPQPAPAPVVQPVAAEPALPVSAEVPGRWVIKTVPANVNVRTEDGRVLGQTPLEVSWLAAQRPAKVVLERPGFERAVLEIPIVAAELTATLKPVGPHKTGPRPNLKKGGVVDPFR